MRFASVRPIPRWDRAFDFSRVVARNFFAGCKEITEKESIRGGIDNESSYLFEQA
jgi:hypothetical protein